MHPLLQINNLQVDFKTEAGTYTATKQVSLHVNRNEILAIVGESGSGKSVTALSILQLLPKKSIQQVSGQILFSDNGQTVEDLLKLPESAMRAYRGNKIAMIFQEPMTSLNPVFSCGFQITEAIRLHQHLSKGSAKEKALQLFRQVQLPDPIRAFNAYPHQLSGGQRQRVMIAMAMSCNPKLLICDEPTTALDVVVQKTILQLIKDLQQQTGMGVLFITHDLGVVAEIADRAVVMYQGSIVEKGTTKEIFTNTQHPYTRGLLACRPALHNKGERLPVISDFLQNKTEVSVHKIAGASNSVIDKPQADVLLKAEHLSVWYPSKKNFWGKPLAFTRAVDDVSFEVYKGEMLGLVGESGCGKTTLGRTLLGLVEPTKGNIGFRGIDLVKEKGAGMKRLRKEIQIIFQDPFSSLNPRLTVGSAITEALQVHGIGSDKNERYNRVLDLLGKVKLEPQHFYRYPHEFSGGQRQRIVIARALALNPGFLVCDESVSALDVSVQAQILNLLNDLKKEFGFTIVFISHDLSVVRYLCDRVIVMNKGRIEESGDTERLYAQPQSAYTRLLVNSVPSGLST